MERPHLSHFPFPERREFQAERVFLELPSMSRVGQRAMELSVDTLKRTKLAEQVEFHPVNLEHGHVVNGIVDAQSSPVASDETGEPASFTGRMYATWYIARAGARTLESLNPTEDLSTISPQAWLQTDISEQVAVYHDNPHVFHEFTNLLHFHHAPDQETNLSDKREAFLSLVNTLKTQGLEGEDLSSYSAIVDFLYENHDKPEYLGATDLLFEEHIRDVPRRLGSVLKDSLINRLRRPDRSPDLTAQIRQVYLDPLFRHLLEGDPRDTLPLQYLALDIYESSFSMEKGKLEGSLPEDFQFQEFVRTERKRFLEMFSSQKVFPALRELYEEFLNFHADARDVPHEARILLLSRMQEMGSMSVRDRIKEYAVLAAGTFAQNPATRDDLRGAIHADSEENLRLHVNTAIQRMFTTVWKNFSKATRGSDVYEQTMITIPMELDMYGYLDIFHPQTEGDRHFLEIVAQRKGMPAGVRVKAQRILESLS